MRHLLTLCELTAGEIERIFAISEDLKSNHARGLREELLPGRVAALLFEKPSLRTRVSFEAAMLQLGGGSIFLGSEAGFGSRESVADFARVLSQYVDVIVVRAARHRTAVELAEYSHCPVINGLTDYAHPCQAMADLFTLGERLGRLEGHKLAYVGDCNNVAKSLAIACGKLGVALSVAAPAAYQFDADFLALLARETPKLDLVQTEDPFEAVRGAAAIYTDVWSSMGQESESDVRRRHFAAYQVNVRLMQHAPGALFMHCLPAHRGEEVTDEVIDGSASIVIEQAANRMHAQKGIITWLLTSQRK
jgi:ornithine carbamoyltransferase